jgi:crotonobetainyl-CoA:carnitine CoA-transferase CaiB-like acyl-CoA transferase
MLGHPEWAADPAYADDTGRVRNREALARLIESVTSGYNRDHWLRMLEANEIPCGPINRYDEVFNDPQVLARSMVVETEHPRLGRIRTLGSPVKMSETPPVVGRRAPLLGEHTEEVLREAGCDERLIAALVR